MVEELQPETVEVEKWIIPFGAKLDTVNMILKAFFIAGADKNFVSQDKIGQNTGLGRGTIGPNLSFLVFAQALEKNEKDTKLYKLTEKGTKYAKAASESNKEEMSKEIKSILDGSFKELVNFVNLRKSSGKIDFDTIFNHIKTMARIKDEPNRSRGVNPAYASGISTLIDMLILAGIVDDSIKPVEQPSQKSAVKPRKKTAKPSKTDEKQEGADELASISVAGMHQVTWGDSILIRLKKGDKITREKLAKIAKQFIDMYVEEESEAA
jgi:large-conductance mechanosensitive channel